MPPAQTHPALAAFAASKDEAAFAKVVSEFGGLVFTSALRRTGDRELSEEVAQNVFAIVARKAKRLSSHPSLTGWLYTTVKLEAAKALRTRQRHNRRVQALADEMNTDAHSMTTMSAEERENWRDALPLLDESLDRLKPADRDIVLGRFFNERSFKEIAESNGSTEAACKMRLKRALEKLNSWLSGRGVTLSATALATGMAAEFSKAAPATVVGSLPANAIAASSGVGFTTILTNTLSTMSTTKSAGLATAAVILLGAVPVAMQHSEANSLKAERDGLQERAAELAATSTLSIHDREREGAVPAAAGARPVARFLADLDQPLVADDLIEQITSAMMNQDMGVLMRIVLPLSELSPEAGRDLIAEVRASHKSAQMKDMTLQFLSTIVNRPDQEASPGDALDQNLADGVSTMNLGNSLGDWAKRDADAAIAWFMSRREAGKFQSKGVGESMDELHLFSGLLDGLVQTDPARAIVLAESVDAKIRAAGISSIVPRLAVNEPERALALVNGLESVDERGEAARRTAHLLLRKGTTDEAVAFVEGSNLDDKNFASAIATLAVERGGKGSRAWVERVAWAEDHVPESARDELIGRLTQRGYLHYPPDEIAAWVDGLTPGVEQDAGLAAQATALLFGNHRAEQALASAEAIGDEALRGTTVKRVFAIVNSRSPETAAQLAEQHNLDLEEVLK